MTTEHQIRLQSPAQRKEEEEARNLWRIFHFRREVMDLLCTFQVIRKLSGENFPGNETGRVK